MLKSTQDGQLLKRPCGCGRGELYECTAPRRGCDLAKRDGAPEAGRGGFSPDQPILLHEVAAREESARGVFLSHFINRTFEINRSRDVDLGLYLNCTLDELLVQGTDGENPEEDGAGYHWDEIVGDR